METSETYITSMLYSLLTVTPTKGNNMKKVVTTMAAMLMTMSMAMADAVDAATDFIAREEGFRARTYICPGGGRTIGYGCTDPDVLAKGYVTEPEAKEILRTRVRKELAWINKRIPNLTEGQQIAVVSLVYNVGHPKFLRSKAYAALVAGKMLEGIREMTGFCKVGGKVSPGLQARRERERKVFLGE